MVGLGFLMLIVSAWALWRSRRGARKAFELGRWTLWVLVACIVAPFLANTFGWLFTEMGRQPWIVYGLMKTGRGISPSVSAADVAITLGGFVLLYTVLGVIDVVLMSLAARRGLGTEDERRPPGRPGAPSAGRRRRNSSTEETAVNGPVASLNTAWFALIGVLWTGYFVLEGFDFGVGMLNLAIGRDDVDRRLARNAIGPVWDGNEVWLIVAAGATFAAFPVWYASMFSGFYLALFIVLAALIVRGVSFEFRNKRDSARWRAGWDRAMAVGSLLPAFAWGVAFTDLVHGLPLSPAGLYQGSFWGLLAPVAIVGGLASLAMFLAHGATFLALKTAGPLAERARKVAMWVSPLAGALVAGTAAWLAAGGSHGPGALGGTVPIVLAAVCGLAFAAAGALVLAGRDGLAFGLSALGIVAVMAAVFTALFPRVMVSSGPGPSLTIWSAASAHETLLVMTVVAAIFVPLVLAYQGWSYWVFRQRLTRPAAGPGLSFPPGCRGRDAFDSSSPAPQPASPARIVTAGRADAVRTQPSVQAAACSRRHLAAGRRGQAVAGRCGRGRCSARPCSWSRRPISSPACSPTRSTAGSPATRPSGDVPADRVARRRPGGARLGLGGVHGGRRAASPGGHPAAGAGRRPSAWRRPAGLRADEQGDVLGPGGMTTLIGYGVDELDPFVARVLPGAVLALAVPALLLAWIGHLDLVSAGLAGVTLVIAPVLAGLVGADTAAAVRRRLASLERLGDRFDALVEGLPLLRAFGRAADHERAVAASGEEVRTATLATLRVALLAGLVLELLAAVGTALVAVRLGLRLDDGQRILPQALAVLILIPEVFLPLRRLTADFHAGAAGRAVLVGSAASPPRIAPAPIAAEAERDRPAGTALRSVSSSRECAWRPKAGACRCWTGSTCGCQPGGASMPGR